MGLVGDPYPAFEKEEEHEKQTTLDYRLSIPAARHPAVCVHGSIPCV